MYVYEQEQYYEALKVCAWRYLEMLSNAPLICDFDDLADHPWIKLQAFINDEFLPGCENRLPLCKLNRWLGYIQGIVCHTGLTPVDAERDFTRPYFRPLDFPEQKTCNTNKLGV